VCAGIGVGSIGLISGTASTMKLAIGLGEDARSGDVAFVVVWVRIACLACRGGRGSRGEEEDVEEGEDDGEDGLHFVFYSEWL